MVTRSLATVIHNRLILLSFGMSGIQTYLPVLEGGAGLQDSRAMSGEYGWVLSSNIELLPWVSEKGRSKREREEQCWTRNWRKHRTARAPVHLRKTRKILHTSPNEPKNSHRSARWLSAKSALILIYPPINLFFTHCSMPKTVPVIDGPLGHPFLWPRECWAPSSEFVVEEAGLVHFIVQCDPCRKRDRQQILHS